MRYLNIGDKVKVIDDMQVYTHYQLWAEKHKLDKYDSYQKHIHGKLFGREGIITAKGNHLDIRSNLGINVLYGIDLGELAIIMDPEGVELIEEGL